MGKFIAGLAVIIATIGLYFGILALIAWGVSAGIDFVTGVELGFWRTLVGIVLVMFAANLVFSPLKRGGSE